jgi:hypothetical protein
MDYHLDQQFLTKVGIKFKNVIHFKYEIDIYDKFLLCPYHCSVGEVIVSKLQTRKYSTGFILYCHYSAVIHFLLQCAEYRVSGTRAVLVERADMRSFLSFVMLFCEYRIKIIVPLKFYL